MKIHAALIIAVAFLPLGSSIECGRALTNECIGATDSRYDPSFPRDLIEQDSRWKKLEGYWEGNLITRNGSLDPYEPSPFDVEYQMGTPFERVNEKSFWNVTIEGSRLYVDIVIVRPPAPESFCSQSIFTDDKLNRIPPGECGVNGYADPTTYYGTSTHELDGSADIIFTAWGYGGKDWNSPNKESKMTWIDHNTLSHAQEADGEYGYTMATQYDFCSDDKFHYSMQGFSREDKALVWLHSGDLSRVSEQEWVQVVNQAYNDYKIHEKQRWSVPKSSTGWIIDWTPTEEEYCGGIGSDPRCTLSPYQEPPGHVRPGVITGIAVAGFVLLGVLMYMLHKHMLKKQEDRVKQVFVSKIAKRVNIAPTPGAMDKDQLQEAFKKMDNIDSDGYITKEELRSFLRDGKMGDINDRDFDALFDTIDMDGSGKVDFVEFCAFMATCGEQFEAEYAKTKTMSPSQSLQYSAIQASTRNGVGVIKDEEENLIDSAEP